MLGAEEEEIGSRAGRGEAVNVCMYDEVAANAYYDVCADLAAYLCPLCGGRMRGVCGAYAGAGQGEASAQARGIMPSGSSDKESTMLVIGCHAQTTK